jgi:hypothetical protein
VLQAFHRDYEPPNHPEHDATSGISWKTWKVKAIYLSLLLTD